MNPQIKKIYDILYSNRTRLPSLEKWLRDDVWSDKRFDQLEPQEYLLSGEKLIKSAEELILNAAPGIYDEFVSASESSSPVTMDISIFTPVMNRSLNRIKRLKR